MTGLTLLGSDAVHVWVVGLSHVAAGSLVAAMWQGAILAAGVALGLRLLRGTPAAARFAVWFAVFAVVVALPFTALFPHPTLAASPNGHAWLTLGDRWSEVILMAWLAMSFVRACELAVAALRVRALWRRAIPVELTGAGGLHPTRRDVAEMNGAPGLSRRAQVCTSEEVDRPTVIGFFSPKIVIPEWLLEKLTAAELEQVVLHEAGHLGRADDWLNLLQKVALVVFPLNPALAWIERRLCFERELAVDERVLQATGAPKAYATCLTTLAEYRMGRRGLTLALGALGRESELARRVGRILGQGSPMKPRQARMVMAGAMLALVVGAVGLEQCRPLVSFTSPGAVVAESNEMKLQSPRGVITMAGLATVRAESTRGNKKIGTSVAHQSVATQVADNSVEQVRDVVSPATGRHFMPARAIQTSAVSRPRSAPGVTSDVEPSLAATGVTQWTVTKSWRGTNITMTTARTPEESPSSVDADSQAAEQPLPSQEVPSYAAVPVRGGWLIFQL